ncbi:SO2930 family diheme c-type cytochrome [Parerythrobacter aestuarii]|uniref:SO2930 family diheme c-type cytochrome n=1 Tax=Parerythrobacter aestuarii TaxID=3020909 RepID=UPI0024DE0D54|nr:SO2930 family diheme c-type cytochrome [Parerythrobacter aestuarii]
MRNGLALLGAAALALAGSMAAQAEIAPPSVSEAAIIDDGMPRSLSEFGFFIDGAGQIPAPGVVPYRLNTPLYSDGATKLRFVYVPYGKVIGIDAGNDHGGLLQFPVGSALIKTFAFGEGKDRQLIETRVLLHRADGWIALPYRWNAEQTEARLAIAGARLEVTTPAGEQISYRIPNKNQCKECHSVAGAVIPIGPKPRNMSAQWLGGMELVVSGADTIPVWEERASADVAALARGYLDVNCAHCHRPGGMASNSGLDLRWEQDNPSRLGVLKRPVAAGRGSGGLEFDIDPGHPERSIIVHRMGSKEAGVAMPELGKATVDAEGVAAVERWIAQLEGS